MRPEETIEAARQGFEASFAEKTFYNRQTQDDQHLQAILDCLPVRDGMRILDLGTGSGYLAFALAKRYPGVSVTGLDIVAQTLARDREQAEQAGLQNLDFVRYDGMTLPFESDSFDAVVSRYALHHFPEIERSIAEVYRVLSPAGCFFLSDPAPNENDTDGFIDAYMQVKKDGHIRFRRFSEWTALCKAAGFRLARSFEGSIRFPRKMEPVYHKIMQQHDSAVIVGYAVEIVQDEIFVTEQVNNLLFSK